MKKDCINQALIKGAFAVSCLVIIFQAFSLPFVSSPSLLSADINKQKIENKLIIPKISNRRTNKVAFVGQPTIGVNSSTSSLRKYIIESSLFNVFAGEEADVPLPILEKKNYKAVGSDLYSVACLINLTSTVSGCYQSNGSKATVSVEVAWSTAESGNITITMGGQTRTIKPGAYTSPQGNGSIVSPQVVAFEVPADGSTQVIETFFGTAFATATCKATQTVTLPVACPPTPCDANGFNSGGTVFNDYDADGTKDTGETTGLVGITVKAYDCKGNLMGTTTTDGLGKYSFTTLTAASYPIRVEFSNLPAFAGQGTVSGSNGKTTTQFVKSANCNVDLGLLDPNDYCQSQPKVFVPCYVYGDPLPSGSPSGMRDALVSFNYGTTGVKDMSKINLISNADSIGTIWGLAYDKYKKMLYGTASLKRHAGLGPQGLGGLYIINTANNSVNGIDLAAAPYNINFGTIPTNSARGLSTDATLPSADSLAFAATGKIGIGDLEISEDGKTLFFVNLFDKKLYKLDISGTTPVLISGTAIPNVCEGGNSRPFGLKVYKGEVYIGSVCDAFTSQNKSDLRASVQRFNPISNTFSAIFDFPLTYPKGAAQTTVAATLARTGWYPWTDTFDKLNSGYTTTTTYLLYPQPILSDIEFDVDGSMILGFADRTGSQGGFENYRPSGTTTKNYTAIAGGDILRASTNGAGTYVLENNAKVGATQGYGAGNNQGPGFGEFYNDDYLFSPKSWLGASTDDCDGPH
jgi:hypothetical protein